MNYYRYPAGHRGPSGKAMIWRGTHTEEFYRTPCSYCSLSFPGRWIKERNELFPIRYGFIQRHRWECMLRKIGSSLIHQPSTAKNCMGVVLGGISRKTIPRNSTVLRAAIVVDHAEPTQSPLMKLSLTWAAAFIVVPLYSFFMSSMDGCSHSVGGDGSSASSSKRPRLDLPASK
ncbi:hypothetical protein F2Q70_00019961 [Brassica cretica]|uniref:Uncharacterized protein n=1 Tax=Brassica cretica TaxID=69181 RepID=A0A3N6TJY7_BRACR|nr:hypothetical protein F2Q70_00019961 [Brassica cretica]KAF3607037.1 hypothetical protein DY000_02045354 [Brassica cretica]